MDSNLQENDREDFSVLLANCYVEISTESCNDIYDFMDELLGAWAVFEW